MNSSCFYCLVFKKPSLFQMGKRRLYSVYIISLILMTRVINISASTIPPEEIHCSRERSRAAWKIIENYLMPFVEKEKFTLSTQCKLHPINDIFRDQEEHKIYADINEWKCGYCKKHFRAEKFLDQHFDNRHSDLLCINSSGSISHGKCLADQCGALHCDYTIDPARSQKTKCNPSAAVRNRHLCEDLADRCFPITEGPAAARLHEFFLRQFCDAHTCSRGWKPFSKGGRKHTSVLYMAASLLILMFLPIFYLIMYMIQRETRKGKKQLKRAPKPGRKHI
ncbi:hypothetical protein CASFOL_000909 [Castilleja foliolosa]|uniref:C2H2-type domain-containing protein n=1 Tax=Castilleja foliolosa TaxID=1961234 RepID=A0ABD3EL28_9LAMI